MKIKNCLRSLVFIFSFGTIITQGMQQVPTLSQFDFKAASVLPTYKNPQGHTMVILSREAYGRDRGTYDAAGGKRDKGEKHPEITAARECLEELILEKTAGIKLHKVRKHINIDSGNTDYIIARISKKSVIYVSDFSAYWNGIRKKFYSARRNAKQSKYREKDHVAVVKWDDLKDAIAQSTPGQKVCIYAHGIKRNGSYDAQTKSIILRPFLIAQLRPFFQNQSFQQGRNQKIRFYQ
jgi:8-oxo-dGTP pyrophosphatase MutT (NUDIX family)